MTQPDLRPARADEIAAVGHLIALSFDDLPQNAYLVPPRSDRQRVMADFFTLYAEHAARYGRIDVLSTTELIGAAVWFDNTREAPAPDRYDERLRELSGAYHEHFLALDELFDKHHPSEPHHHLAFLAIHPDHQGQGLGSLLMAHTHAELDRAGVPAYLEATNDNNVRLYHRRGYADMDPFAIELPDGTPFFRMWRAA